MQYNPAFVTRREILSATQRSGLHALALKCPLDAFRGDTRNYEEMQVDFVYTSAKIEGNTYDRIDTDTLLRMGITAGGKRYSDAVMLFNLRNGFDQIMRIDAAAALDLDFVCDLHKVLMRDLLPVHEQGLVRTSAVQIGASSYVPPDDPGRLRTEMKFILETAAAYADPFEQAIYLHCNLAYLQYFRDGNKRTARMIQTAALVKAGILPLFFSDTLIDAYQRSTVRYYETGDYAPYAAFFLQNYALTMTRLEGLSSSKVAQLSPDDQQVFQDRLLALDDQKEQSEVGQVFWSIAVQALAKAGRPERVNWADVERQVMVVCLSEKAIDPDQIEAFLFAHSPGAISLECQAGIREDLGRLSKDRDTRRQP